MLTVLTWASGGRCTATAPAGQMRKREVPGYITVI